MDDSPRQNERKMVHFTRRPNKKVLWLVQTVEGHEGNFSSRTGILLIICSLLITTLSLQPVNAATDLWVATDRALRRTCPDNKCGVVGQLFFREKATILQEKDGWGRLSRYYDASCRNGISEYVESGNAECAASNGIVDGRFAEWVRIDDLTSERPPDPSAGAAGNFALVKNSDDYRLYKHTFAKAAGDLIKSGRCSAADFLEMGGWTKSTNKPGPVYFTYCGEDRIYINAMTGDIHQ